MPMTAPALQRRAIDALFSARHLYATEAVVDSLRQQLRAGELAALITHVHECAADSPNQTGPGRDQLADRILLILADGRVSRGRS